MNENWGYISETGLVFIGGDLVEDTDGQEKGDIESVAEDMIVNYNRSHYYIQPIENFTIIEKEELE